MRRQLLPALQVAAMTIASLAWVGGDAARASDTIVLNANRYDVLAGRYSAFAKFQTNLQRVLNDCGKGLPSVVPVGEEATGKIGLETRRGIQRALRCEALRSVPTDSAAHDGIITESVWHAVMGAEPVPSVVDRANALVLSFEATDFGEGPEWNFCQDSKRGKHHTIDPKVHDFVCYNTSDPCSYLTWGPRGATAGSGREIQWVLWLVLKRDPSLVEKAFGKEFPNVERFLRLKSSDQKEQCETDTPLARFMCAIWLDPRRRKIWEDALATLGRSPLVRAAYAQLYALIEFDGEKLRDFDELWRRLGLVPNEIDYAFFLDRVTHLDGPPDDDEAVVQALSACMQHETAALTRNAAARRCLARLQPHPRQPDYRLARDVAYYLDGYPGGVLDKKEISTWAGYVPLSAVHSLGLSEARPARIGEAPSTNSLGFDPPLPDSVNLTSAEIAACPAGILAPLKPQSRKPRE